MAFRMTRAALAALSVALLAACGDSGPSQFNAAAMNGDLAQLSSIEDNNDVGQAFDGIGEVLGGGSVFSMGQLAGRPLQPKDARTAAVALKSVRHEPAISASAGIPPEDAGKTWVYNSGTQAYEPSDLPGAPSNGVRILLYEQDVNGDFILPLVSDGHVDLTDLSSGSTGKGRLQAVKGSTTFLDYTVTVTGDDTNGTVDVAGFLSSGLDRLNVDFHAEGSVNGGTSTFDIQSSLDFPNHDLSFDFSLNGSSNDDTQTGAYSVNETIESPNGRMDLVGSAGYQDDFAFTIKVNGDTWATYDNNTLTPVDGRTLTAEETEALTGAAQLTVLGLLLPIGMVLVMAALTGTVPGLPS